MTAPDTLTHLIAALTDRYRIDRELGQGGMATVYLAEDVRHRRKVAIKVLHPELSAVIGSEAEGIGRYLRLIHDLVLSRTERAASDYRRYLVASDTDSVGAADAGFRNRRYIRPRPGSAPSHKRQIMLRYDCARCLTVLAFCASGCATEVPIVEVQGECGTVFTGQVCTWARTKGDSVLEAGAVVPLASIEGAAADAQMAWPPVAEAKLKLPEAVHAKIGLTQLTIFWESMGHPPSQFMTPHFDFHFYVVPPGEEMSYDCKDTTKPVALPASYILPDEVLPPDMAKMIGVDTLIGICVPTMGMHSLPISEMERKDVFRGNMVIGYYGGKPIFIEPMLTRAMLLEKKSFDLPIPTIPGLSGMYPRVFHAEYDEKQQSYRFIFSGFAPGA